MATNAAPRCLQRSRTITSGARSALACHRQPPPAKHRDAGFTLVEIVIAIVLVGVVSTVAVLGISRLTRNEAGAACAASRDAAISGSNVYLTDTARYPTTLLQMTAASSGSLQLSSSVIIDTAGTSARGQGWTLTMTPGISGAAPSFQCTDDASSVNALPATAPTTTATATTTVPRNGTSACPGEFTAWVGEYYANQNLVGPPSLCRDDTLLAFNWGNNGPGSGLPIWRFSARWTRSVAMASGSHTFTLVSDDGSRLFVDGVLIIDWWSDHTPTSRTATVSLSAGIHLVVLEYYQFYGPAQVSLAWT